MSTRIHRLSTAVANQIAAGEVIERPASVVKELLENSLDAKASKIKIDIVSSGLNLIRVIDDGMGIEKEDLWLAIAPHATSKISCIEDLQSILSMGFRGEALASIASVAHFTICSARMNAEQGWQLVVNHQQEPVLEIAPYRLGTTVEVRDLFFNTPARRRFLKSDKTEFEAIYQVVKRAALSNPQVTFTLVHNQKQLFHAPRVAMDEWSRRAQKILGQEFYEAAIWIDEVADGLRLQGAVAKPNLHRSDITAQYFFVNQRPVRDRVVNHAIAQAFGDLLVAGRHPCYALMLSILPAQVDVNVHPSKYEVRFVDQRSVHDFIYRALSRHLSSTQVQIPVREEIVEVTNVASALPNYSAPRPLFPTRAAAPVAVATNDPYRFVRERFGRTIGIIAGRYLILENEADVVFVDLRQAKEISVLKYLQTEEYIRRKPLLIPQFYDIPQSAMDPAQMEKYGFEFALEGERLRLQSIPVVMREAPTVECLVQWGALLAEGSDPVKILRNIAELAATQWLAELAKSQEWLELLSDPQITQNAIKTVNINDFPKLFEELSDAS